MQRFFAPGRTELAGNHTDHQLGRVLAASVDVGITARATRRRDRRVCIHSKGFRPFTVALDDLVVDLLQLGQVVDDDRLPAERLDAAIDELADPLRVVHLRDPDVVEVRGRLPPVCEEVDVALRRAEVEPRERHLAHHRRIAVS